MYKDDSLTLHTDLYQINMMQVYFNQGIHNKKAVFEVYFRQLPFKNGFAVFAGLERIVNYLENLTFSETDIAYLKDLGYPEDFLDYLANLKLELTINSALEGDLVFANEPIFQVEGPLAQCQLVETVLLPRQLVFVLSLRMLLCWNLGHVVHKRWMQQSGEHVQP